MSIIIWVGREVCSCTFDAVSSVFGVYQAVELYVVNIVGPPVDFHNHKHIILKMTGRIIYDSRAYCALLCSGVTNWSPMNAICHPLLWFHCALGKKRSAQFEKLFLHC